MKLLILVFVFINSVFAETVPPIAESKARVLKGCLASGKVSPQVCNCVVLNFDKKLIAAEYKLLADEYDSKDTGKDDIEESALSTFDREVAENCIKNSKWRVSDKDLKN